MTLEWIQVYFRICIWTCLPSDAFLEWSKWGSVTPRKTGLHPSLTTSLPEQSSLIAKSTLTALQSWYFTYLPFFILAKKYFYRKKGNCHYKTICDYAFFNHLHVLLWVEVFIKFWAWKRGPATHESASCWKKSETHRSIRFRNSIERKDSFHSEDFWFMKMDKVF